MVFPVVMGALLLWTGVAFIAGVGIQTALAIALCLVGMGFVLGAFVGGSKALILPAVVLAAALVTTSVIDIPLSGPVGRRTWVPQTVAQLSDRYELSVGEGTLDLTDLDVGRGDDVDLVASVGIGHLRVEVPDDVAVEVHARAGAGDALLLGESNSGVGVEVDRAYGEGAASGTLHLDLEVGMGQVELVVRRPDDGRPERTAPPTPTGAPAPTTPSTITGA
jgi:predicted membrane protein